jgi:hypothetical protein
MNTPKAFANFSPGLERSDNPGIANKKNNPTLKGFVLRGTLSGFNDYLMIHSQGCRGRSNPGLKLANAFGVISN